MWSSFCLVSKLWVLFLIIMILALKGLPTPGEAILPYTIDLNSPRRITVRLLRLDNSTVFIYNVKYILIS